MAASSAVTINRSEQEVASQLGRRFASDRRRSPRSRTPRPPVIGAPRSAYVLDQRPPAGRRTEDRGAGRDGSAAPTGRCAAPVQAAGGDRRGLCVPTPAPTARTPSSNGPTAPAEPQTEQTYEER